MELSSARGSLGGVGTSLSSVKTLLPAASVVLAALLFALILARADNRVERLRERRPPRRRPPAASQPPRPRWRLVYSPNDRRALPSGHRVPLGWRPYLIFSLLPVWWLLGLSFFQWPLIVAPLVYPLCKTRGLKVPRRFGLWLLFIVWTVISATQLSSSSRAIAWAWRDSFYIASTILFIFIFNSRERRLPTSSVVNALTVFWIMIVVGGWFGVLFPTVTLASPAEHVFPGSLLHNTYFYAHVHLQFAEVQHFLGFKEGRPQAFFAYTNAWGSTFAMMTPFALGALSMTRSVAWRRVILLTLASSVVPVVFSLDRGLWLSLGAGMIYATIRFATGQNRQVAVRVLTVAALLIAVVAVSPLGALVQGRFSHKTGDTSRLARDQVAQAQITANSNSRLRRPAAGGLGDAHHEVRGHRERGVSPALLAWRSGAVLHRLVAGVHGVPLGSEAPRRPSGGHVDPRRAADGLSAGALLRAHRAHADHLHRCRAPLPPDRPGRGGCRARAHRSAWRDSTAAASAPS